MEKYLNLKYTIFYSLKIILVLLSFAIWVEYDCVFGRQVRQASQEELNIYSKEVKLNKKQLSIIKLAAKLDEYEIHIVINENINGKRWIDWGRGVVYVDGKAVSLDASHGTFDELTTRGDRKELIERFKKENPDKEIIAVLPNGNTMFNSWFVSFIDGKLLHNAEEPVFEREYSSLVVWKSQDISIEDIRFEKDGAQRKVKIKDVNTGEDITDKVLYTTYGQRLVKDGNMVNPVEIYEQFDDLGHLFFFPLMPVKGRDIIGGSIVEKMHQDKSLIKDALEGKILSFSKNELNNIELDELKERLTPSDAGPFPSYKEVGFESKMVEGTYTIDGYEKATGEYTLKIKLIRNQYRHFIAGVKNGELVTVSILGKSGRHGATIEEAAEIAKREGLKDAVLLCNGKDVWLRYRNNWIEDTGREGISSVILVTKDKRE